jgi:hypothetical protein
MVDKPFKDNTAQIEDKWHPKNDFKKQGPGSGVFEFQLTPGGVYAMYEAFGYCGMWITQAIF